MEVLDQEDEQNHKGSRFGVHRRLRKRSNSHQQLVMDCVGGGGNNNVVIGDGPSEENVPLPDYERLSQSARLPDDPDPREVQQQKQQQQKVQHASTPQQQKPAAWKLIDYVRSRNKSGGGGCGTDSDAKSSDGDKESEDGSATTEEEKQKKEKKKEKKRSSWLPDPERRWPVQGFY